MPLELSVYYYVDVKGGQTPGRQGRAAGQVGGGYIRHMKVPLWPIRKARSWGYLAGSWREATPNVIIVLINIRENETILFR